MAMMTLTALTTSMVSPQKCMYPHRSTYESICLTIMVTSELRIANTSVIATQKRTMRDPRKFARRKRVVRKTQARAIPRLRNSSLVITSSVSQLLYSWHTV